MRQIRVRETAMVDTAAATDRDRHVKRALDNNNYIILSLWNILDHIKHRSTE